MNVSLNLVWVLVGAFLVMFMQVGFAMVETGFTRAKNAVNTMAMNLVVYPIGVVALLAALVALVRLTGPRRADFHPAPATGPRSR